VALECADGSSINRVRALLSSPSCPDIEAKDSHGQTALHLAALAPASVLAAIVHLLLEKGAHTLWVRHGESKQL
jgi:ankyrin repeat protein